MKTIRRNNIVDSISERAPYVSKGVAGACLDILIDLLRESASAGSTLDLSPFGRFRLSPQKARKRYDVVTKTMVNIPAKNRYRFIPDTTLTTPTL